MDTEATVSWTISVKTGGKEKYLRLLYFKCMRRAIFDE